MLYPSLLFAAANVDAKLIPRVNEADHRFTSNDILIVISVAVAVAAILVVWAVFIRKKKEEADYVYPQATSKDGESSLGENGEDSEHGQRRRRRKKRRVRDHRPRNPTLQQTGGLPPPRPEDRPPTY